jgi:hypothetical protein
MAGTNQRSSSDKDKRKAGNTNKVITTPPLFHINSYTMNPLTNPSGYPLSFEESACYMDEARQE